MQNLNRVIFLTFMALLPTLAFADMVWPGLYIHAKSYSLIPIVCGLLIEFIIFRILFKLKALKCAIVVVVVNAVSALAAYFLYVFYGFGTTLIWHSVQGLVNPNAGTFNPFIWTMDCLSYTLFTTITEYLAIRLIFKIKFKIKSKTFLWFFIANLLSTMVGLLMTFVQPPML